LQQSDFLIEWRNDVHYLSYALKNFRKVDMGKRVYLKLAKTERRDKARKTLQKGLELTSAILLSFQEAGEGFLKSLPSSYPGFKLLKDIFGVQGYSRKRIKEIKESTIRSSFYRLRKQGLLYKDPKKKIYYLTDKGKKMALNIKSRYIASAKPLWDKKFRIVFFDIPESKKGWRNAIRRELAVAQFHQLQKSVYIGKHPLPEDFYRDLERNNLLRYIFLLTVGDIDRPYEVLEILEKDV